MNNSITCSANNCVYYSNNLCSANKIHVSGLNASITPDTHCSTFQEKNIKNSLNSLSNINIDGEIKQFFSNSGIMMYPEIECDARTCKFNDHGSCLSNSVNIIGNDAIDTNSTYCNTFCK